MYFAGDTYCSGFREIAARFRLEVALLPITTFRIPMIMGETSAVSATKMLKMVGEIVKDSE